MYQKQAYVYAPQNTCHIDAILPLKSCCGTLAHESIGGKQRISQFLAQILVLGACLREVVVLVVIVAVVVVVVVVRVVVRVVVVAY